MPPPLLHKTQGHLHRSAKLLMEKNSRSIKLYIVVNHGAIETCSNPLVSLHHVCFHLPYTFPLLFSRLQADIDVAHIQAERGQPKEVPSHWLDHLSHLRPGERRALNQYIPLVQKVNAAEPAMQRLTDEELSRLTTTFRARLASGEPLRSLLPEAFAAVREAASRVLGMRHYDVQILGGIVLAEGHVAEMATGEGKTLVAALPAYLYALTGKGVHVVTVNDYLAQRDAAWIGKVLQFMGLSVGVVTGKVVNEARQQAFASDVTYVTAYELAFSFLQDNLAPTTRAVILRRPLHYAIVDEVDSILIDEARNPFIVTFPEHGIDFQQTWRCAVAVAQLLEGPSSQELKQLDNLWQEAGGIPQEPLNFDYLPDYRTLLAALTQRGMRRAVKFLASPGIEQIIMAGQLEKKNGNEARNENNGASKTITITSFDTFSEVLFVVLMSPTSDGRLELIIQKAGADYPRGFSNHHTSLNDDEDSSTVLPQERRVIVNSKDDITSALAKLGLRALESNKVTEEQWAAAAPAALWTGGDRAWGRYISQAVRAVHLYIKDIHYILKDGEVVIVDTATGRERSKSRWQSGLHQALEAKEESQGIKIRPEDLDKGRTTYQSLFNLYAKLCGMTGTAATEMEEFSQAYDVSVVRVPPHRPSRRQDNLPIVMLDREGWENRVTEIVGQSAAYTRPILLGTSSVEESEAVLQLVSDIPFRTELSELDARRLEIALMGLPPFLPDAILPEGQEEEDLTEDQQESIAQYKAWAKSYRDAIMMARRLQRSLRLTPEIGASVDYGFRVLRAIANSSLLLDNEKVDAVEVSYVMSQVVERSRLGKTVPINLLNARPDRARFEAEIIAQAGLPGTITVATAMAGRGTDILLGGNPKGLTLIALKHYFLPIMAAGADDFMNFKTEPPLFGLPEGRGFLSEPDMKLHLPPALFRTYSQAKLSLIKEYNHTLGRKKDNNDSKAVSAAEVSELLSDLLESVEVDRSVFLLRIQRAGLVPSLEAALEWTDDQIQGTWSEVSLNERALRRYALLQWLWFDGQCERYAAQVRSAGGLVAAITSIQDTRRTELQLRGRAGRQGDPGETYMISHREDPAVQSILSPAQQQGLWSVIELQSGPDSEVPYGITKMAMKTITTQAEQLGLGAREQTRRYDAAIDPYRRHVFRLRRIVAGGGDAARAALAHRQLRRLAEELVLAHVDVHRSPKEWKVYDLLRAVQSLFRREELSAQEDIAAVNSIEQRGISPMHILTGVGEVSRIYGGTESGAELQFQVQLDVEGTAAVLRDSLVFNGPLPCPEYFSADLSEGWMTVRRRVALRQARKQEDPTIRASEGSANRRTEEKLRGRYSTAARRLQLWLGDLLIVSWFRI